METTLSVQSFHNCRKFRYTCTNWDNIVYEHRRLENGKWISEKHDKYGNRMGVSIRTDQEMQPIFNHVRYISDCDFYPLSTTTPSEEITP